MPLPAAQPRKEMHTRSITLKGFRREDGLWEVDGELIDEKPGPWRSQESGMKPAELPVHRMSARIAVDDELVVREAAADMENYPFAECIAAPPGVGNLVGASLQGGWRRAIDAAVGNTRGCTHMRELLGVMAAVVFQSTSEDRRLKAEASGEPPTQPPGHFGKCVSWHFDGPVVARLKPEFRGWRPPAKP